jgi:hypothetical protein
MPAPLRSMCALVYTRAANRGDLSRYVRADYNWGGLLINLAQFLLQLRDQPAYALRSFIVHRRPPRKQAVFHDLHFEFYSIILVSHCTHGFIPSISPTRATMLREGPQSTLVKTEHGQTLFRRVQLALYPAHCFLGFQRVGAVAFEALERARTVAAGRQR